MDGPDARALLDDTERLRRRARADRHPSSVPLLVFASLTLLGAPLAVGRLWPLGQYYWLLAGPVGFVVVGWWYRRQQVRSGVGQGRGSWTIAGVSVLLALVLLPILWISPLPAVAAGLVAIAVLQRNAYLAVWAVLFGVLGTLEQFFVLSNRLYDLAQWRGWFPE
ncbi:MAG TPA: hypothetical protein VG673_01740, partial [Actinomycetota bacterium]|nr:hypothetical protein [Actinomycetota bacterium]